MVVNASMQWSILVVCRAQCLSDAVGHFALYLPGIITKVWTSPPLLLRFIPADCSFSNANGARLGLGFLPCQLATGAVGRI